MLMKRRPGRRPVLQGTAHWVLALLIGLSAAAAHAEDQGDPPTRVGRIAIIEGTVSFHPDPNDPWAPAVVNYPVAPSTAIWTEPGARAEIELGEARVRLDGGTELDIDQLDDHDIALSVPQGRVDVSLRGHPADERYHIETARGSIVLIDDGAYRIVAGSPTEPTRFATFAGRAELDGAGTEQFIVPGQEVVTSTGDTPSIRLLQAGEDAFDHWSEERDRALFARPVPAYVPPMPGVAVLNEYGAWRDVPEYGHVWVPTDVDAGWAPYREGSWSYVAPWGWTWVDDAPWGFAPFHYGRWVQVQGAWGWIPVDPGADYTVGYRPVYAPAMVSFIGDPGGLVAGGIGIGAIGWVALGPGEVWHPWYHASDRYFHEVNRIDVNRRVINDIHINETVVNRTFVNQRYTTVVARNSFAEGRPVRGAILRVQPEALNRPLRVEPVAARGVEAVLPPRAEPGRFAGPGGRPVVAPPAPALHMAHPAPASAAIFHEQHREPGQVQPVARPNEPPARSAEPGRLEGPNRPAEPTRPAAPEPGRTNEARPAAPQPQEHQAVPRPVEHPAVPQRPAERPAAPRPEQRQAAPHPVEQVQPQRPVERQAAPQPEPRPVERPVPQQAPRPVERPAERQAAPQPAPRPVERPVPQQAPHPVERPAAPAPQQARPAPAPQPHPNQEQRPKPPLL